MMDFLNKSWRNRWAFLGQLTTEGEEDVVLSPMVKSWWNNLRYERIEALEEETEQEAEEVRRLEVWLEDEFIESLRLDDASCHIMETSVIRTSDLLEDQC